MAPKLTHEQREAIKQGRGRPVPIADDESKRVYYLVSSDDMSQFIDDELKRQLQVGFDQVDSGEVGEWNVDEIRAEARRRHAKRAT